MSWASYLFIAKYCSLPIHIYCPYSFLKKIIHIEIVAGSNPHPGLMWLSGLGTWLSVHKDVGSIPGLTQWVKYPALLQAASEVADAAQLWFGGGCNIGRQLQLQFNPILRTSICHWCGPKRPKKKKERERERRKNLRYSWFTMLCPFLLYNKVT